MTIARAACGIVVALVLVTPRPALAVWSTNGNVVCNSTGVQAYPVTTTDAAGGLFVVWQDSRGSSVDLYAQRLTAAGNVSPGWPANGLAVCTATGDQKLAVIVPDGAGGLFLAWEDYRQGGGNSDVYAQRVTGAGAIAAGWPTNGLALCTETAPQGYPALLATGGTVIVVWQDDRSGTSSDLYAQRVSGVGAVQWDEGGVPVCLAAANQLFASITTDAAGGAIVAWQDARSGDPDVYVQRLSPSGVSLWTGDGVALCTAAYEQLVPRLAPDGSGGAVVAWDDYRDFNADLYAQRVNASGVLQWGANGVALCTDVAEQYGAGIVIDGAGGAIVAWNDYRGGSGDIYAQRVTAAGAIAAGWPGNGSTVCASGGEQFDITLAADAAGGVYVTWSDARAGAGTADIYAHRLGSNGSAVSGWNPNGTKVCDAVNTQLRPAVLADGNGCLVAWADDRGTNTDVYAGRVGGSTVDVPLVAGEVLGFAPPFPNPARGGVNLRFRMAATGPARLTVLDLAGRRVRGLLDTPDLAAGDHAQVWDGRDESGAMTAAGLYLVVLETADGRALRKVTVLR